MVGGQLGAILNGDCFSGGCLLTSQCYNVLDISPTIARSGHSKIATVMAQNWYKLIGSDWTIAISGTSINAYIAIAEGSRVSTFEARLCSSNTELQSCSIALSLILQQFQDSAITTLGSTKK